MNKYWAEYDKYFISLQAVFATGRERAGHTLTAQHHSGDPPGAALHCDRQRPLTTDGGVVAG
jgi:hypothetical protein